MSKIYRTRKVDDNQAEIVGALERVGFSVAVTNMGDGFPDLVVARASQDAKLVEVKNLDSRKESSVNYLTKDQKKFHALWRGKIYIVTSIEDAIKQLT